MQKRFYLAAGLILAGTSALLAEGAHDHEAHRPSERAGAHVMSGMYGPYSMGREASGTAWLPDSSPHEGLHTVAGQWGITVHGFANVIYDDQGGKRGDTKTFSQSMLMAMAQRPAGPGTFGLRTMLSLDPLMGKSGYPLLLQTGETADGRTPLIDRQHPHDFFMELAASYSVPVGRATSVFFYGGLPGEPALGPATFMHRFSGIENPEAPLSHHWLDSTHITFGVLTAGYIHRGVKIEASGFRGREPDEDRWDIESPRIDSWSARFTVNPTANWSAQASYGDLHSPEQLAPEEDVKRVTASVTHNQPLSGADNLQTTVAWGRNREEHGHEDAWLAESALRLRNRHTVFGRIENVDKDELFAEAGHHAGEMFNVSKATLGYVFDVLSWRGTQWGVGGTGSLHLIPSSLEHAYGEDPTSYMLFVRAKLGGAPAE